MNDDAAHVRWRVAESFERHTGWWKRSPANAERFAARKAAGEQEEHMPNLNKVLLMGNLTRDPEMKYLPSQTAVTNFGLACNRKWRTEAGEEREEVVFVDVTAFGKQAETITQYCAKGKPLYVEGRLKLDVWDDKQGGGKRSKMSVVLEHFQFLGSKEGGTREGGESSGERRIDRSTDQRPQRPAPGQRPQPEQPFGDAPPKDFDEADIPFLWGGRGGQPL